MGCVWDMSKVVFVLSIGSSRYPLARPVWRPRMIPTPSTITPSVPCFPLPLWPPPPPPPSSGRVSDPIRDIASASAPMRMCVSCPLFTSTSLRAGAALSLHRHRHRHRGLSLSPLSPPSPLFSSLLYLYLCGPFLSALPCAKRGNPTCVVRRTFYHY